MAVALITGCSSGIGLETALEFGRKGDTVFASMRDTSKAGDLTGRAAAEKLAIEVVQLDVTDEESVRKAVAHVLASAGRVDVLVNNAGIGAHGPIEETDDDEAKAAFETNFFGALRTTRAVLPSMREQRSGAIVNVTSLNGRVTAPYAGIYSASKYALEAASEALYYEVHPFGIRVIVIEPGAFETRIDQHDSTARRFTESSPYFDLDRRFTESMTRLPGRGERDDPRVVAEAIYGALHSDEPKLRYLVGDDAKMIGGLRRQLDDEQFEQTMRKALDIWD